VFLVGGKIRLKVHCEGMYDRELYRQILNIREPWAVTEVELRHDVGEVVVRVEWQPTKRVVCPECGEECPQHDRRERSWRHLDTCQYKTILTATVPRVKCRKHGVLQVSVPWAEPGSRLTALFERLVIDWLQEANESAVSARLRLSWNDVDGVMQRAVKRGMERRAAQQPTKLGIDETAFHERHEYVAVINDVAHGVVIDVLADRKQETLENGLKSLGREVLEELEVVTLRCIGPLYWSVPTQTAE
jgi:transposase